MNTISVIITAYNAEKIIKRCLESVKWANEIVVIDLESNDDTTKIARQYTKHIFSHRNVGYVEPVRNFSFTKAHGEWILILDADEEVPSSLADKLQTLSESSEFNYIKVPRKNIIFGKWIQHTGWWPDHLIRFFRKGTVTWGDDVHNVPQTSGEGIVLEGEENALIHHNYDSITEFFHRNFERYALFEAEEKIKSGYVFDYKDAIRFPSSEFLRRYFLWEGYKDGLHGLILSILMAFYHFAVFAHLWEKNKFIDVSSDMLDRGLFEESKKSKREFNFWLYAKKIGREKNSLKKIALRIQRKLSL